MLFNTALLSGILSLTSVVLAVPSGPGARSESRRTLPIHVERTTSDTQYSSNWAGAVSIQNSGTFTSVTGTFTTTNPSGPAGSAAAAWVGIDGWTCTTAILQAGVTSTVSSSGPPTYDVWLEAYPEPADYLSGITISAGHVIKLSVTTSGLASGAVTIENLTNGESVTKEVAIHAPLCGQNAEWIVESFVNDGSQVPLADFGTITFTNAVATGAGGETYTPDGATILELEQNNQILTSVSTSGSSVTIKHV